MRILALATIYFTLGIHLAGCRPNSSESLGRIKFSAADRSAKNIAFIVGSPNDLSGVTRDVETVSQMMGGSAFGYEVVTLNYAKVDQIFAKAEEIGTQLSPNSTVFFYFSGHGSEQGYLIAQGLQAFKLSSVAKKIGTGYAKGKFKRFIAVMDSCFSGQNVNGSQAMFLSSADPVANLKAMLERSVDQMAYELKPRADGDLPFEESLVLSAAQKTQTSLDAGASVGGIFTSSWRKVMEKNLASGESVTLRKILDDVKTVTISNSNGGHTPAWKAMPDSLLDARLNGPSDNSQSSVFVALGDAPDGSLVFVSLPPSMNVSTVEICRGDKLACTIGQSQSVAAFNPATDIRIGGRNVFRGTKTIQFNDQEIHTVVMRANDSSVVEAQSFRVRKR